MQTETFTSQEISKKDKIIQTIEFNLNVLKLMLGNKNISVSDKASEKVVHHFMTLTQSELESEIEHALEQAARKCKNNIIEPDDVVFKTDIVGGLPVPVGLKLEDLERRYILQTLYFAEQNRTKAAEILGISIRTLRNKINQYRLEGFL